MRAFRAALTTIGLVAALCAASAGAKLAHIVKHNLLYSAHADVDGDGRPDLITLRRHPVLVGHLNVRLASGRRLAARMRSDAPFVPGLATAGNVNGIRGEELFVDIQHFAANDVIGVYTYARGRLRLAGTAMAYGSDFPVRNGITCTVRGRRRLIVQHQFQLHVIGPHWRWTRKDTVFVWKGTRLRLAAEHRPRWIKGHPPARQVGVQCGSAPRR